MTNTVEQDQWAEREPLALHRALSSGMIQDWQEPVVQEIKHPLIGQVIPL